MRKKLLTLAGAVALFSNSFVINAVEDISWGLNLSGGGSFFGAKYKDKEGDVAQEADMGLFLSPSLFFGYNFSEIVGIEMNLGARMFDLYKIKAKATGNDTNTTLRAKSPIEADITNGIFDVLLTIIPVQYIGGCIRLNLGPQFSYAFIKDVKIKGTSNKAAEKIINDMNMDFVFKANASLLGDIIAAGIIVNYTVFDQINADEVKKIESIKDSKVQFGSGKFKVGASVGLNIAAMID